MTHGDLCKVIRASRFQYSDEYKLQRGIAALLTQLGLEYKAEVRLNAKDRIDFLVGDVGIEVKTEGALAAVTRQLWRYAQLPEVKHLVLVTTSHAHQNLPEEMNGRTLEVVYLLNSFL